VAVSTHSLSIKENFSPSVGVRAERDGVRRLETAGLFPLSTLATLLLPSTAHATLLDTTDGDFVGLDIFVAMNIALLLFLVALPNLLGSEFFKGKKEE
jgi:hypothetical protein